MDLAASATSTAIAESAAATTLGVVWLKKDCGEGDRPNGGLGRQQDKNGPQPGVDERAIYERGVFSTLANADCGGVLRSLNTSEPGMGTNFDMVVSTECEILLTASSPAFFFGTHEARGTVGTARVKGVDRSLVLAHHDNTRSAKTKEALDSFISAWFLCGFCRDSSCSYQEYTPSKD